jgi:hypothetical protein
MGLARMPRRLSEKPQARSAKAKKPIRLCILSKLCLSCHGTAGALFRDLRHCKVEKAIPSSMDRGKEDNRKSPGQEVAPRIFPDILLTPATRLWHEFDVKVVVPAVSLSQIPPDCKRKRPFIGCNPKSGSR